MKPRDVGSKNSPLSRSILSLKDQKGKDEETNQRPPFLSFRKRSCFSGDFGINYEAN
jgi:hypothetical protein